MEQNTTNLFSKVMNDLNQECLKHLDDDISFLENMMFTVLHEWYTSIRTQVLPHTAEFDFWCELVSRWEPMVQVWPDFVNDNCVLDKKYRHVDVLPDELD